MVRDLMLLLLAGTLFCGGCRSFKQALNDEPKKKPNAAAKTETVRASEPEVFPGSHRHSRRPSPIAGDLTAQERAALDASMRDSHIPSRDMRRQDKEENKASTDWVFGR